MLHIPIPFPDFASCEGSSREPAPNRSNTSNLFICRDDILSLLENTSIVPSLCSFSRRMSVLAAPSALHKSDAGASETVDNAPERPAHLHIRSVQLLHTASDTEYQSCAASPDVSKCLMQMPKIQTIQATLIMQSYKILKFEKRSPALH